MHGTGVFTLSDVALILEMEETRVKNWTIGRPIEVRPSVRTGSGPGSRNLYGIDDLYLLALADQICRDGFTTRIAEKALELARLKVESLGKVWLWLVIRSSDAGEPAISMGSGKLPTSGPQIGQYVLALRPLIERVRRGIEALPARVAARKKSRAKGETRNGNL